MPDEVAKMTVQIVKTIRTTVTLEQKQYEKILRDAVGAPDDATVDIKDTYGVDISITWSVIEYEEQP